MQNNLSEWAERETAGGGSPATGQREGGTRGSHSGGSTRPREATTTRNVQPNIEFEVPVGLHERRQTHKSRGKRERGVGVHRGAHSRGLPPPPR